MKQDSRIPIDEIEEAIDNLIKNTPANQGAVPMLKKWGKAIGSMVPLNKEVKESDTVGATGNSKFNSSEKLNTHGVSSTSNESIEKAIDIVLDKTSEG